MDAGQETPKIVAIAGGSGSGKTTLTRAVAALLGERCAVLEHDSYYRCLGHLPATQRARANFDHPDSLENELLVRQLHQLRRGQSVQQPLYDFASHMRRREVRVVAPRPVILVEGILVLALPQLQRAFDLRVFVEAPADLRFRRRSLRDTRERGRSHASVQAQWQSCVQPMHERFVAPAVAQCDLVLSGRDDVAGSARRIAMALASAPTIRAAAPFLVEDGVGGRAR